jgi:hypothetical protein
LLESGKAIHPETSILTEYEEVWRAVPITSRETFQYAWILESLDGKTFLGRVGGVFQAMMVDIDDDGKQQHFSARRQLWKGDNEDWITKYEVGNPKYLKFLPSISNQNKDHDFKWEAASSEEDVVDMNGSSYIIRAITKLL